jgi:hypothetical protein
MKAAYRLVATALSIGALSSSPLVAQWAPYPALPAPKTADGEVDLNAPAPRTQDGRPDFTGTWRGAPQGGRGAAPAETPAGSPPLATFRDVGSAFKDGLPLTDYGREVLKQRMARHSKDNPEASCLPMGIMQFWTQGFPRKFVQTPRLLVILYEASSGIRQIFIDGRPLPSKDEPQPWYYGYSTAR